MTLFSDGLAMLDRHRKRADGVAITYSRGAASVAITAVRGRTEYEAEDSEGAVTQFTAADFLILAAELILGGEVALPRKGDRITCGDKTYEVLAIAGAQCYGADPSGTLLRIHTKQIASS